MSIDNKITQTSATPANGFNYSKLTETRLFYDNAGASITATQVASDSSSPQAGDLYAPTGSYNTYRCTSATYSQGDSKTVTGTIEYTDMPAVTGGSSTDPQSVDISQPGYCSLSERFYTVFQDAYYRSGTFPFTSPEATATDSGYVSCNSGKSLGQGNLDSAGSPISWPVLHSDIVVSLTRYVDKSDPSGGTDDRLNWTNIISAIGTRRAGADSFLGKTLGPLLFTGASVVRSYEQTSSVNYELQFTYSSACHLQQVIGSFDSNGAVALEKVTADTTCSTETTYHAKDIKTIQPFTGVAWGAIMTTEELALLNRWYSS